MVEVRRAKPEEAEILTDIAVKSEEYWGYDSAFMESFKVLYKVTGEFIEENLTFIIEEGEKHIGFYSILISDKETSLEYFYIEPEFIGQGYGKLLWAHMVNTCKMEGIDELVLVTSPQAKDFYIKMGATQTGEVESLVVKGRRIPSLSFTVNK